MAGEHAHKATSWVVVGLIVVASVLLGFAFVMQSLVLGVIGGVVGLVGVVMGAVTGLMDDAY